MAIMLILFHSFSGSAGWEARTESLSTGWFTIAGMAVTEEETVYLLDRDTHRILCLDEEGIEQGVIEAHIGAVKCAGRCDLQYLPGGRLLWLRGHGLFFSNGSRKRLPAPPNHEAVHLLNERTWLCMRVQDPFTHPNRGADLILYDSNTSQTRLMLRMASDRHADPLLVKVGRVPGSMRSPWLPRMLTAVSPDRQWLFVGSNTGVAFQVRHMPSRRFISEIQDPGLTWPVLARAEIASRREEIRVGGHVYRLDRFPHPKLKPPIARVFCGDDNRLWVELTTLFGAKEHTYRVYNRHGLYSGAVSLPVAFRAVHANTRYLWGFEHGAVRKMSYELR